MELLPFAATTKAPVARFTGDVYSTSIIEGVAPSRLKVGLVRFAPGARTNWHSHAVGQVLHVTEGMGLVGTRDGSVIRVRAGDTIHTPPGQEHWHGATPSTMMCHLAIVERTSDDDPTTWLEPVDEDEYAEAQQQALVPVAQGA